MTTARNQPQYDLITGAPLPQPLSEQPNKEALRASLAVRADASSEEFRALIHKLQYELDSLKQEREALSLRHDDELRIEKSKAENEYRRAQKLESSSNIAVARATKLENELLEVRDQCGSEKSKLEKRLRVSEDEVRILKEEAEDLKSTQSSAGRQLQHDYQELEANHRSLQEVFEQTRRERDERTIAANVASERVARYQKENGDLEGEIVRLKAQVGNADDHDLMKKELTEQVEHMKKLEAMNLDQGIELKRLREQQKAVDVVEEEKRALQTKLNLMNDLRKQLSEAQLQKQMLEDERKSWTAYLENESVIEGDDPFETPEDVAKAYIKQKVENASLTDKLGKVSPELTEKDQIIQSLEEGRTKLNEELEKLRQTAASGGAGGPDIKTKTRLERQRALAVKEVEYLRAQLKTFDTEESEFQPEQYDAQKAKRIAELEEVVDGYRREVESLHSQLTSIETSKETGKAPTSPIKRPREAVDDERIGELSRKNRSLQNQLSELTSTREVLTKELAATKSQLTALQSTSRTRILELRKNPTSVFQTAKISMLTALREENEALISRERSSKSGMNGSVPEATISRLRLELQEKESALASAQKHTARLKSVFASKTREWRATVASTLGWDFDFQPNGRVRVTSVYNPGIADGDEEGSNSIIFDGEKGTMKCSGGPRSAFASDIDGEIRFWVDEKREVPCFLATLTLKFWDDTTKAQRVI